MAEHKRRHFGNLRCIACAYDGGNPIPVFEKATNFWLYYMEGNKIYRNQELSLYPKNTQDLITQIAESRIDGVICKMCGPKALHQLKEHGIDVYIYDGYRGKALEKFLAGEMTKL